LPRSHDNLTLPKLRKPARDLLRTFELPLQHPLVLLAPDPDHTLELLRPDIEPLRVVEDIVCYPFFWQDVEGPQQLRERNEEGIARQICAGTDASSPT
jgi:hypothetical protein